MQNPEVLRRFESMDPSKRVEPLEYNYNHFKTGVLVADARRTFEARGILPGEFAPDFELPAVGGSDASLSRYRGMPVILHFGSFS